MKEYNSKEEIRQDIKENALVINSCKKNIRKLKKMIRQRTRLILSREEKNERYENRSTSRAN